MSIFDSILSKKVKSSKFDLSFDNKLTCQFGTLIPILCQETLPGDYFRHSHEIFAQFAPMNSLMMHHFDIKVEYFHVPNRILWADFEKFLVGGEDGKTSYVPPFTSFYVLLYSTGGAIPHGIRSLADYMGLPTNPQIHPTHNSGGYISLLPFRAYQKIYNDFYRDENLIADLNLRTDGGEYNAQSSFHNELVSLFTLRRRAWRKDYFTSALPWPQKGDEVTLPIQGHVNAKQGDGASALGVTTPIYGVPSDPFHPIVDADGNVVNPTRFSINSQSDINTPNDDSDMINFFLSEANIGTINDLRTAEVVQEWLEKNARGGTRYVENIFSHFGVRVPDYRLDRPEFIGSSRQPFVIGNVYSTNSNDFDPESQDKMVQGYPTATATSSSHSGGWKYKVKEHGWIIGILSVVPKAAYFQGINKKFQRQDKFDYYWPEFANLGEQAIHNRELYLGGDGLNNDIFGYTPRYAEYKHNNDEVHGDYRDSLNFFHDARIFSSRPTLSKTFIEVAASESQLNRIFNYQFEDFDKIYIDIYHHLSAVRKMPYFGIPKFL